MKASQMRPDSNISILMKSGPGEGKTIAASTFCLLGDIVLFYFDKHKPVELFNFYHRIGRPELLDRIEVKIYSSYNANEYVNDLMKMAKDPGRYIAGITDSVTMLTTAAVGWSMSFRPGAKSLVTGQAQLMPGWDEYKVETSLVTQALDICKGIPWYNIWTAHPLPQMKMEGTGSNIDSVKKVSSLVSYGSKVGAIIPGQFTEIYHFNRQAGQRTVWTDLEGEDYAKTAFTMPRSFIIQDKLFYEVWKPLIENSRPKPPEVKDEVVTKAPIDWAGFK